MAFQSTRQLTLNNCDYENSSTQQEDVDLTITPRNFSFLASLRSIKGQDNVDSGQSYFKLHCGENSSKRTESNCPFAGLTDDKIDLAPECTEVVNNTFNKKEVPSMLEQACQEDFLNCIPEITESPSKRYLTLGNKLSRSYGMPQTSINSVNANQRLRYDQQQNKFSNVPNTTRECNGIQVPSSKSQQNLYSDYYSQNYGRGPCQFQSTIPGNKVCPDNFSHGTNDGPDGFGSNKSYYCHKESQPYPYRHEVELTVKPDNTWLPGHQHSDVVSTVKVRVNIMQTCNSMPDGQYDMKNTYTMWDSKPFDLPDKQPMRKPYNYSMNGHVKKMSSPLGHQCSFPLQNRKFNKESDYEHLVCKEEKTVPSDIKPKINYNIDNDLSCLDNGGLVELKHDVMYQQKTLVSEIDQLKPTKTDLSYTTQSVKQDTKPKRIRNSTCRSVARTTSRTKENTRKTFTGNKLVPILPRQSTESIFVNGQFLPMGNPCGVHIDKNKQSLKDMVNKRRLTHNDISCNEMAGVAKKPFIMQPDQGKYPMQYTPSNSDTMQTRTFPVHMAHHSEMVVNRTPQQPRAPPSPIQNLSDLVAKLIPDINNMGDVPSNVPNNNDNSPCLVPCEFVGKSSCHN